MQRTTLGKALAVYGDTLIIAATGAIAKKGQGPDGEVRVIFDGTRGIFLNHGIRIRDQVRFLPRRTSRRSSPRWPRRAARTSCWSTT